MQLTNRKNTVLAALLAMFLAWRVARSVQWGIGEAETKIAEVRLGLTATEDDRIAFGLARWEKIEGLSEGREYRLFQALRQHVQTDGTVFFVSRAVTRKRLLAFTHMNVLLYPRHFLLAQDLPPNWREGAKALGRRCYVVYYDQEPDAELRGVFTELAAGEDFVLFQNRANS